MPFDYGLDDKVPPLKTLLLGLQWAAILISSIVILGKVIGGLHFDDPAGLTLYLQKLFFICGLTLFCQIFWGHRLPLVPGPAAVLLVGALAGRDAGISAIYSAVAAGGLFIAILAATGVFRLVRACFTPNVVAAVLLLIAFTIAPSIQELVLNPDSGINPLHNLMFSLGLVVVMFVSYRLLWGIWKSTLIIWGMIAGSLGYALFFPDAQTVDLLSQGAWWRLFLGDLNLHLSLEPGVLIAFLLCFVALSVNDLGSIQSVNELLKPAGKERRVTRGIVLTGLANIASGFLGVIGPVNYSLSPGIMLTTRCASRYTLLPTAAILVLLSVSPAAAGFIGSVPSVVIGSVLGYVMISQIAAGLILAFQGVGENGFQLEDGMVIGAAVLAGTIVSFFPQAAVDAFPPFLRPILANGFVVGVLSALLLEFLITKNPQRCRSTRRRDK